MPNYSPGVASCRYFPGVSVLVYEKNGLKRGPALNNASFSLSPPGWPNLIEKLVGPSPLSGPGGNPLYQVTLRVWTQADGRYDRLFLIVSALKRTMTPGTRSMRLTLRHDSIAATERV